jgi:hypothetical protein
VGNVIPFVLSEDSVALLGDDWLSKIPVEVMSCRFGKNAEEMILVPPTIRWVVVGKPRIFAMHKETRDISPLRKGLRMKANDLVTATRLLLAPVWDNQVINGVDGNPQLVTLKLTSSKTNLIGGDSKDPSFSNLVSLNQALLDAYGLRKQPMLHLVSVRIDAIATELSNGQKASMGILFKFVGGARALSEPDQQRMAQLAGSDEVREFLADPFHLGSKTQGTYEDDEYDSLNDYDPDRF